MYERFVDFVRVLARQWSGDDVRYVQPPCSLSDISAFRRKVKSELGLNLPPEQERFLHLCNGLVLPPLQIFGTERHFRRDALGGEIMYLDGLVEANLARRPGQMERVLILAEDDGCFYGFDVDNNSYGRWDAVVREQETTYRGFDDLVTRVLHDTIQSLPEAVTKGVAIPEL